MVCEMKLTNIPTYDIFVAEVLLLEQEVVVIKGSADCRIALSGGVDEVSSLNFFSLIFFLFVLRLERNYSCSYFRCNIRYHSLTSSWAIR